MRANPKSKALSCATGQCTLAECCMKDDSPEAAKLQQQAMRLQGKLMEQKKAEKNEGRNAELWEACCGRGGRTA